MREKLRLLLHPDQHAAEAGAYGVWSLYYDTRDLDLFYQKVNGEYEHLKLRLRCYDGRFDPATGSLFAECKLKYQDRQDKWRLQLGEVGMHQELWRGFGERYPMVGRLVDAAAMFPACYVSYRREPMEGLVGGQRVRLNFDTNIAAARPGPLAARATGPRAGFRKLPVGFDALLEVKTADPDLSAELGRVLASVGARQSTFSKYGAALEYIGSERLALGILV